MFILVHQEKPLACKLPNSRKKKAVKKIAHTQLLP